MFQVFGNSEDVLILTVMESRILMITVQTSQVLKSSTDVQIRMEIRFQIKTMLVRT